MTKIEFLVRQGFVSLPPHLHHSVHSSCVKSTQVFFPDAKVVRMCNWPLCWDLCVECCYTGLVHHRVVLRHRQNYLFHHWKYINHYSCYISFIILYNKQIPFLMHIRQFLCLKFFFRFGRLISLQLIVLYIVNLVKAFYLFTALQHSKDTMDYTFAWNMNVVAGWHTCHWFAVLKTGWLLFIVMSQRDW